MVYYQRIDGVRVVAVGAVMATHFLWSYRSLLVLGNYGVQLFFVISGFLITGILKNQKSGFRQALKTFLVRRVLRIFPLYYFSLVFLSAVHWVELAPFGIWHWLYGSNWLYWLNGGWISGHPGHFWSLAVEEQFYLFWPLVFLGLPKGKRNWAPVVLVLFGLAFRMYASSSWIGETNIWHVITPSCFEALGAGSLLAFLVNLGSIRWISRCLLVSLCCLLALHTFDGGNQLNELKYQLFIALSFFLIWTVCRSKKTWFDGFLLNPSVRWLGTISYGLYVWHNFMQYPWKTIGPWTIDCCDFIGLPGWVAYTVIPFTGKCTLTLVFATLSWYSFEKPLLRLKKHFPYQ